MALVAGIGGVVAFIALGAAIAFCTCRKPLLLSKDIEIDIGAQIFHWQYVPSTRQLPPPSPPPISAGLGFVQASAEPIYMTSVPVYMTQQPVYARTESSVFVSNRAVTNKTKQHWYVSCLCAC